MRTALVLTLGLAALAAAPSFAAPAVSEDVSMSIDHPLLAPWKGPYGGVPPFDQVQVADFAPAIRAAMKAQQAEIDAITSNRKKATFDNTIAAYENSGRALNRIFNVYGVWNSTMSSPEVRAIETELAPEMAAYFDSITQNGALFARIAAVAGNDKAMAKLTPEQRRLTTELHRGFVRQGAALDATAKARLGAINQELAGDYTAFGQNLLADEETFTTITDPARLAGVSDGVKAAMKAAAEAQGVEGWIVVNTRSSVDPFLTQAEDRALREVVWRAFTNRGDNGDAHDNNALITKILALRAERAKLLGFETHAHWSVDDAMAGTPDKTIALMEAVWTPAVARVKEEVADMQAMADSLGHGITIAPWDYHHYQEKVRKERYDLDAAEVRPYMQLDNLREGMFWMAQRLYGLTFRPIDGVPVNHPDVAVWEVVNDAGEHVGLWYFDPYARTGKRSGAWMNAYRSQERFGSATPIVSNNSNFVKGAPGEPVLISWDDASTLFHEFGHALHGLLSDVTYPTLAGTNVARDYVEFPSQLHEHWLGTPELLARFALHVETGAPIPAELVAKIEKAATFNQGFGTVEYLASALIDMKLHLAGATPIDPDAFERETLAALGMPEELVMRHRTPQFAHVFSGDGYAAGYYSYLWADTLTADAAEAFKEAGSMWDRATADRLVKHVLSVGNTVDAADGWRAFRGREVDVGALMRDRGFPTE